MKRKLAAILTVILSLCLVLAGCSQPTEQAAPPAATEAPAAEAAATDVPEARQYVIGVCAGDLSNPYFVTLVDGIKAKAAELGNVTILVEDPKQDAAKQVTAIENFVTQGVDGIIMIPFDLTAANEALASVYSEGVVKILCQSGKIDNANTNVSARDYDMGYALGVAAGKYIASELGGEAEIGMLNYPALENILERERGIKEGIAEYAPNAKVVATAQGGTPDAGTTAAEAFLQANPNMSVIVSINDAGALGALAAVEGAPGINPKFFIGGIDALDQALSEIKSGGYYKATVDITPYANGVFDLELMMKMLNGETVELDNSVNVKAVTSENIGDYKVN